ncbi:CubicO group peptidase (beta-lactamase class C family) [Deinococcus metalli]|uniref:CubicO group peptidase (Beta-lactamase class C family) n=1 Tax=Deinococcus metalli TaxID=1141878 RepID=A0A7W8KDZ2_9DEIO|nr:serine hydrolase domain-containing protein [Deinococcus metalli]MBB5376412.1 CubicO group peptidase (beta-lactamase class C family) [Deinococcus metalli]GHF44258.1 serine hydrolase [Deinococcus metalli]
MAHEHLAAPPEAVNADARRLDALNDHVATAWPDVTSVLVARHGRVVTERYFGITPGAAQDVQSVTKSAVSLLVGAALDRGHFRHLDQPVLSLLPPELGAAEDARWHDVTLRHLLTMTGGVPSELGDPAYDEAFMASDDPVRFTLAQPLVCAPGQAFHYSNGGVHVLGAALTHATGRDLAAFAQDTLFTPLGIAAPVWPRDAQGRPLAYGGLLLPPRDLLRVGLLMANRGVWAGTQLIPRAWIDGATRPHVEGARWMECLPGYGWLWWSAREHGAEAWYATGYGGQYVAVFPALELVVVMTGRVTAHPNHRHLIAHVLEAFKR